MKKLFVIFVLLVFLTACGPEITGLKTREKVVQKEAPVVAKEVFPEPNATVFIEQVAGTEKIDWGFDSAGNLVSLKENSREAKFYYKDGLLRKVSDGNAEIELEYVDGYLSFVKGDDLLPRRYVVKNGDLASADDYDFTYTNEGNLWIFREGAGSPLTFYYTEDDADRLDYFKKGNVVTHFYYDSNGRITRVDDNNVRQLIMAYGREDRVAALSGALYGIGETFDYDSGRIQIVSNVEKNIFQGNDAFLRKKAFDYYLACTRVRKNTMSFEPIPYVVLHEYYGMSVYDYMMQNFYCRWIK